MTWDRMEGDPAKTARPERQLPIFSLVKFEKPLEVKPATKKKRVGTG